MGLPEKQMVTHLQQDIFPKIANDIQYITGGGHFQWDIDWASLETNLALLQEVESKLLNRVVNAFRYVGFNELRKKALREGVKKIEIKNFEAPSKQDYKLTEGVLHLEVALEAGEVGYLDVNKLQQVLEKGL